MPVHFVTDSEIGDTIVDLIKAAKREITIVSPYNKRWDDVENELAKAHRRGVQATVYYRDGTPDPGQYWQNVTSVPVKRLHAKIYTNENAVLITSLNVGKRSMLLNREAGIFFLDADSTLLRQIRNYINGLHKSTTHPRRRTKSPAQKVKSSVSLPDKFTRSDIPIGATLNFVRGKRTCTVAEQNPLKVWYGNNRQPRSLSYVTKQITKYQSVAGPRYWTYRGVLVSDLPDF